MHELKVDRETIMSNKKFCQIKNINICILMTDVKIFVTFVISMNNKTL